LEYDTFPEATPTDFALIGGLNFSAAMIILPAVTSLTRRFGKHAIIALGAIF
jgi:hypothetical protein